MFAVYTALGTHLPQQCEVTELTVHQPSRLSKPALCGLNPTRPQGWSPWPRAGHRDAGSLQAERPRDVVPRDHRRDRLSHLPLLPPGWGPCRRVCGVSAGHTCPIRALFSLNQSPRTSACTAQTPARGGAGLGPHSPAAPLACASPEARRSGPAQVSAADGRTCWCGLIRVNVQPRRASSQPESQA